APLFFRTATAVTLAEPWVGELGERNSRRPRRRDLGAASATRGGRGVGDGVDLFIYGDLAIGIIYMFSRMDFASEGRANVAGQRLGFGHGRIHQLPDRPELRSVSRRAPSLAAAKNE